MPPGRPLIGEEGQPFNVAITQTEDGYVLRACELADVHFTTALDEAVCYPAPGIGGEHVRDLSATILSSWLVLRGSAVFHGSSVAGVPDLPDGHAVAFLGPSFAGKSTWAALMCSAGARFVTDDALPIGTQDGRPVVEGGCPELRLRQFETVSWPAFDALPHRLTVDGRMAVLAGDPVAGPLPLLCVVVLDPQATDQVVIERLPPREAMLSLVASHRVSRMRLPRSLATHFERASEVAETVPVWKACVPASGPPQAAWADQLVGELRSHWDGANA